MKEKRSRIFVLIALVLTAVFSVIGTGFSFWSFDTDMRVEAAAAVQIATGQTAGRWTELTLPSVAVLDEGITGFNNTITGINFYKQDISPHTKKKETLIDTSLTVVFETDCESVTEEAEAKAEIEQNGELKFGLRIRAMGKLEEYVCFSAYYNRLAKQTAAPEKDYIDLLALATTKNFDGTDNFEFVKNAATGKWEYRFLLETTTLNRSFQYINGKAPHTQTMYEALRADVNNQSAYFLIELWQGGGMPTDAGG